MTYIAMIINPFLFWMIAFHEIFEEIVDHLDLLHEEEETKKTLLIRGSVEEALVYFKSKLVLL
jgi:hypothetical protein